MENREKIIFICSAGRSGSTLLRNIFDFHPEISVAPELRFFDLALSNRRRFNNLKTKRDRILFAGNVINKFKKSKDPLWGQIKYNEKNLIEKLSKYKNYRDIYIKIIKTCSTKKNKSVYVDKIGTFFIGRIIKTIPEAIFIHMLRDGREVCASAHKRGDWANSYLNIAEYWDESIRKYDYYYKKYNNGKNFYEIKYKDLINNYEIEIKNLFKFLGANINKNYFKALNRLSSSSSFDQNKPKKGLFLSKNFTDYFKQDEQKIINSLLNKTLKNRGYNIKAGKIDIASYLKAKTEKIKIKSHFWSKRKGVFYIYKKFQINE